MADLQTELANKVPGKPKATPFLSPEGDPRYWTLYYRYGGIPQVTKGFRFDGSAREAGIRARKHCEILNLIFITVRPLIVDLDFQEEKFLMNKTKENFNPEVGIDL